MQDTLLSHAIYCLNNHGFQPGNWVSFVVHFHNWNSCEKFSILHHYDLIRAGPVFSFFHGTVSRDIARFQGFVCDCHVTTDHAEIF